MGTVAEKPTTGLYNWPSRGFPGTARPKGTLKPAVPTFVNGATLTCTSLAALAWLALWMTPTVTKLAAEICALWVPHVLVGKYDAYRLLLASAE